MNPTCRTTLCRILKTALRYAFAFIAPWLVVIVDPAFAASTPVRVASYGANGTHWPSLIPTPFMYDDTVPNIIDVSCNWQAISNAIVSVTPAQAAAGVLIRLVPGTLTGKGAGASNAAMLNNIGSSSWHRYLFRGSPSIKRAGSVFCGLERRQHKASGVRSLSIGMD